jgi:molybdopterin synthase catalytic subunit
VKDDGGSVNLKVLYFATYKQRIGVGEEALTLEAGIKVRDLKKLLREKYPQAGIDRDSTLVAINKEFAFDDQEIPDGAEVAVFPPVSGGGDNEKTVIRVTHDSLDLHQLVTLLVTPTTGASCVFTGFVRGMTRRGKEMRTAYLEYEAYTAMAEEKMSQVAQEIRERWPKIEGIAIVQRIGHLEPGTPTVAIACTAGHRDEGVFEAARYGIDRLKQIVPIWKKEVGPEQAFWVEGPYLPQPGE